MKIEIAKNAGFCFGVQRACEMACQKAIEYDTLYTLGDIIHNKFMVEKLRGLGIKTEDDFEALPDGTNVLIRLWGC